MKTITKITMLVLSIIMCFLICSCKNIGAGQDTPGADYIYKEGSRIHIVYAKNDDIAKEIAEELQIDLMSYTYCKVSLSDDEQSPPAEHEIVIGNTNRDISKVAYARLDRISFDPTEEARYLAYTDGKSVAFMYDEDVFEINLSAIKVRETFIEKYVKKYETLSLKPGVIYSEKTRPLEYQTELDAMEREQSWQKVLEELEGYPNAEAIVKALKSYYKVMATPEVVGWFANLYEVETGAFYYSNSARDTEGYGVDIESTAQAIEFLNSSGMLRSIGGMEGLPDSMKIAVGKWVKGLQDPNGYFYHPQWPKSLTETRESRMGRDLDRALVLLRLAGLSPTYTTPNGVEGDYTLYDGTKVDENGNPIITEEDLTGRLADTGAAEAVSKIVPAAAYNGPYYLRDKASFESWLFAFDIRNDSYSVGNTISAVAGQIKNRDNQLAAEGAGYSLVSILEKWLYDNQNPSTGTWDWNNDPLEGSNGVLKIVALYNGLELEFPRPELAIENAIDLIYGDLPTSIVCDIYNTWFEIDEIFENLIKFSDDLDATKAQIQKIRDGLLADAPMLIAKTAEKLSAYRHGDGSYGFGLEGSSSTSQGMPVAVPNSKEGDVNATVISITGTLNHMLRVLGISQPDIFGKAEYCYFYSIVNNLGAIIKDPLEEADPITFDYETPGYGSNEINTDRCTSGGTFKVIADPRTGKGGNVFLFDSKSGGGDIIQIECSSNILSAGCFVFETEMMVESGDETTVAQIFLHRAYMLTLRISDGKVYIEDSSSASSSTAIYRDLGISVDLGQWFRLKVEYYPGEHNTVRAVIYINGVPLAISDNYYDQSGLKINEAGVPSITYNYVEILGFSANNLKLMIDDVMVYKTQSIYDSSKFNHDKLLFDIDPPVSDELIYDFNDSKIPEDFDLIKGEGEISVTDKLTLNTGSGTFEIDIPENKRRPGTNVSLFEAILNISSAEVGAKLELSFRENNSKELPLVRLRLIVKEEGGKKYATICEAASGNDGKVFDKVQIPIGTDTKLRIEYYSDKRSVLIYVNDSLAALTSAVCTNANRYLSGKLKITNVGTTAMTVSLDNLKFEGITKSFDEATKPDVDRVTYDFENGIPDEIKTTGNVGIVTDTSNKLVFNSAGSSFTVPLNNRGIATTVLTTEFDLKLPEGSRDGGLSITILGKNGNALLDFVFEIKNRVIYISERTEKGQYTSVASAEIGSGVKITVDYFKEEETTNIYIGGMPVLSSSVVYTPGVFEFEAVSAKVSYYTGEGGVTVDNLICETFNKVYNKLELPGTATDNKDGVITFEGSATSLLPGRVTTTFKTSSAKLAVTELVTKLGTSKVLEFTSGAGNNDYLTFEALGSFDNTGVNALTLSADIKIDFISGNYYQILFKRPNDNIAYMLILYRKNGTFHIQDASGNSESNVPGRIFGKEVNTEVSSSEEINLRVEIYFGDTKTVRYKTYINDKLMYVSNNYYGKSISNKATAPYFDISSVSFMTESATAAKMYIDNVGFFYENLTLKDDPLNGSLPGNANGDNFTFGTGEFYSKEENESGKIVYENYSSIWTRDDSGLGPKLDGTSVLTRPNGSILADKDCDATHPGVILATVAETNTILKYTSSISGSGEFNWTILLQPAGGFTKGGVYVFESDVYFAPTPDDMAGVDGRIFATFSLEGAGISLTSSEATRMSATMIGGDKNHYKLFGKTINADQWYNIRIEYDANTGKVGTYIDGTESGANITFKPGIEVKYIGFSMNNALKEAYTLFDCTYLGSYGEPPAEPEKPVVAPLTEGEYYKANGGLDYSAGSAYSLAKYGYFYGTYRNSNSSPTQYTLYDQTSYVTTNDRLHLNLATDPADAANKVLWMHRHNATDRTDLVFTNKKTALTTGNCLVFETNLLLADVTGIDSVVTEGETQDYILDFSINKTTGDFDGDSGTGTWWAGAAGDMLGCIYAKPNAEGGYTYYLTWYNGDDTTAAGGEIKFGQWCSIRFEAYENGTVKMYVNGICVTSKTFKSGGVDIDATYDSITAQMRWGMTGGAGVYFDNTFVGIIEKAYE